MQRPVLGAHQQRANREAIQQSLSYGAPPHMAHGTLGFSGHREPHRADNPAIGPPLPIPPAVPSPFPDAYSGIKTLKFLKIIFHSTNATSRGTENSDFTVKIDKEVLNNINVGMISLSDIVFPAGQYLIEDEWSRIDYNEGIVPTSFFRDTKIIYPDVDDPDNYTLEQNGKFPIKNNTVEQIIVEDNANNVYRFRTSEPFGTSIEAVQSVFNESFVVQANRFRTTGIQSMSRTGDSSTNVSVQTVTSAHSSQRHLGRSTEDIMTHEFRVKLNTNITAELEKLNDISGDLESIIDETGGFGYLAVTNLASPLHLASAATTLIQNAPVFRKNRFDPADAELEADYPRMTFNVSWDAALDRFFLTYSASYRPVEMPTIDGEIFEYMGFPVPYKLPDFEEGSRAFNKTIAAPGNRQTSILSGTRVRPGHYLTGNALASAMEEAFNGTWFGRYDETSNIQNPLPFNISIQDSGGRIWKPLICAGRYTPYELAAAFNNYMTLQDQPFRMLPLYRDSIVYVGMRIFYDVVEAVKLNPDNDKAYPFTLLFESTDQTTIDPRRIGYERENYGGATAYFPVAAAPRYPTILQGNVPILIPSIQHYRVSYNSTLRRLTVKAEPFAPILGCVSSSDSDAQTVIIDVPIAHGAAAGEHIFITKVNFTDPADIAVQQDYCDLLEASGCNADAPGIAASLYPKVEAGDGDGAPTISCLVLPTESIDESEWIHGGFNENIVPRDATGRTGALRPTQLKLSYGGTRNNINFDKGDLIYITFGAPQVWSWDCSWNVSECINRQAIGIDPAYYCFNTSYPITTPERSSSKYTAYVFGTDALANTSTPKNAIVLQSATMSFPPVNLGIVIADVAVFNLPNSVNLHPFKDVYLVVTINRKDGDGTTIGIETVKETLDTEPEPHRLREPRREDDSARGIPLVNGAQINALAHILIGPKHPDGIVDLNDRLFEIQYVGVQKIDSFRFQFLNPDGTHYKFHGREVSVGLLLSTIGEQVVTTQ